MLDFTQTNILKLAITWVGNKSLNEGTLVPRATVVSVNDFVHDTLIGAFLKPFEKSEEFFYFYDEEDVSNNAAYQSCMQIFADPETLSVEAAKLTQRLYDFSTSSKLTSGELFVTLFDAVGLQDEQVPAIGIFKIVNKDAFLKVDRSTEMFALGVGEGIATGKLALAAVIFGVDEAEGYRILAVDGVRKKDEDSMWFSQFLACKPIEDHYFNTRHYMNVASEFINGPAAIKFGLDKSDKIDLLNRSSFYFKENQEFEVEDFSSTLFSEVEQQDAFKEFKEEYSKSADVPLADQFDISKQAVQKSSKVFKSVIKLDNNFQIYVKGRRDWIERGFDEEKGKPFYKMYFDVEE
jgi:hypothetical protein